MGLAEVGRIGRVIVHPVNPNVVYVCALGRATGPQAERGVYRTDDGGKTWKLALHVNDDTGCSGLSLDQKDPNTLFAGMWQVVMKTYSMTSGGPSSAIYVTHDAGVTWTDQGKLPKPAANPSLVWTSDPVLAVNTSTGAFYYSGLCDPANTGATSAIGLIKGRFNGSTFTWGTPSIVRTVSTSTDFLDKQWIAVNPANGKVFVSYTWFNAGGDEIDVQSADSSLTTWSSAVKVSLVGENGNVQGSRPAVAPDGSLYVVYYLIGAVDVDYLRVAKSTNQGVSFGTPVNAVSFYANFGSGAPGFNRAQGIQFPSIAIERSSGPHNGRIFLTWAESMNWFDDEAAMVSTGFKAESPTDSNGTATNNNSIATATPFTIGQTLEGAMASNVDLDYWSTTLNAGQTLLVECDSLQTALDVYVRLIAPDGVTRLALSEASNTAGAVSASYWIFTAPTTGTYYVRIGAISSSGRSAYRVRTGFASNTGERGRDRREHVAPVERATDRAAHEARLGDRVHARLGRAERPFEHAVVGTHERLAVRAHRECAARGAHARIHDHEMDRAGREVGRGGLEHERGARHLTGRDLVREIHDMRLGRDRVQDAAHHAGEPIRVTEVREERDDGSRHGEPPWRCRLARRARDDAGRVAPARAAVRRASWMSCPAQQDPLRWTAAP
mgnify:CR=1 FL=1